MFLRRYLVPAAVVAIAALGCADPSGVEQPSTDATIQVLTADWPSMEPGDTLLLQAQVHNIAGIVPGGRPLWTSSAPEVVSVVNVDPRMPCPPCDPVYHARATAVSLGRAVLTAHYGSASASLTVEVGPPVTATPTVAVVVDRYSVVRRLDYDGYAYYPLLRLRERLGIGDGYVTAIQFHLEGLGPHGAVPNWKVIKTVPAGGMAEMIQEYYGEPEFYITGGQAADTVSVRIRYQDASGRRATLAAKVAVEVR